MEVVDAIKNNKKYNKEVLEWLEKITIIANKYNEEPCNHDIVVKFYGTIKSHNEEKPLYICLGCQEDLTKKAKEMEKNPDKNIIDFTSEFWHDVSKADDVFKHYALIDYLRGLAIESSIKMPDYTDADFTCMVNDNVSYIMKNNDFKPCL